MQTSNPGHEAQDDTHFIAFAKAVQQRWLDRLQDKGARAFCTNASGLWEAYLGSFADPAQRQRHHCGCCRRFIERFGGLVTIDESGRARPALWHGADVPAFYRPAVDAMQRIVAHAEITGPLVSAEKALGRATSGTDDAPPIRPHLAASLPADRVHPGGGALGASAEAARKREDFRTVRRALDEFTRPMLQQAVSLLRTDALYRSEKVLGQAEWLLQLQVACGKARGNARENLVWRATASAPAGFCHPRASMIGTLLEDIAAGLPFDDVARRFAAKMHPLQYQRPQAAPTRGAIEAAEKLVEKLGLAPAFARRYAHVDEVEALWRAQPRRSGDGRAAQGLFASVVAKDERDDAGDGPAGTPPTTMTWMKFARDVLPRARRIEAQVGPGQVGAFSAFLTAVNADAPPLLQWDAPEARNPVSWYFYHGGAPASQFGVPVGWNDVLAVTLKPSQWGGRELAHQGRAVMFVLAGARDTRNDSVCLFPETLRSDLHGVRSVVEAYSRGNKVSPTEGQHAAGLMFNDAGGACLRVTTDLGRGEYRLDRWE